MTAAPVEEAKLELVLEALRRGHIQKMVARGRSMSPSIADESTLELRPCSTAPGLGSVVAARSAAGRFVIHRVVGVRSDGARLLKGDNNTEPDGWFLVEELVAVVTQIDRGTGLEPMGLTPASKPAWKERIMSRLTGRLRGRARQVAPAV